jgi:hypothetical protein
MGSRPDGSWPSALSADAVALGAGRFFGTVWAEADRLRWLEFRVDEGGRGVLVEQATEGMPTGITADRLRQRFTTDTAHDRRAQPRHGREERVRRSLDADLDPPSISVPRAIEFPTGDGGTAHAFYYPPVSAGWEGPTAPSSSTPNAEAPTASRTPRVRLPKAWRRRFRSP